MSSATADKCVAPPEVQRALDELTGTHGLPGAAIEVTAPGCEPWVGTSGVADLSTGRPMPPHSRFRAASVTKTFTAAVVLQLVAERRLRLDATVERYLPGVIRANGYDGRKITVRQLLSHTSGLPDHMNTVDPANIDSWRFRTVTPDELITRALSLPHPEKRWHYSTTNYVLLGLIVGKVTGRDVETEVTRRIIKPLRLADTYWPGSELTIRGEHPRGYYDGRDVTEFNTTWGGAGGALISSTTDLTTFYRALLSGDLLPDEQLAQMRHTVAADPDRLWPGARYGLGLIESPLPCGGTWFGHAGTLPGYRAVSAMAPDGRQVSLILNGVPATDEADAAFRNTIETALCPTASGMDRFYHQQVTWQQCQQGPDDEVGRQLDAAGARCADIVVPLDYRDPDGRTITVAISRLRATERRVGPLLLNNGGPGGDSLGMPLDVRDTMGAVGKRYDLIGMDPRFVGRSTPLDCGWPTSFGFRAAGVDRAGFDRSVAFVRDLARRCAGQADLLPYASTRNTARDMDVIRGALGERRLSYLGYSYGTYLGAVYSQLFPSRVHRMVLDGPVDPRTYGPELLSPTGPANEAALADWADWAAAHHPELGNTGAEVLATARGLIATAANRPLRLGEFQVDDTVVPLILYAGVDDDRDERRTHLAAAVRDLHTAAQQGSATPSPWLAGVLTHLLTGANSAGGSAQMAILCADVPARGGIESHWRTIERTRDELPTYASVVHNIGPCAFWPEPPRERPTRVDNDTQALIVAATGDPRTIYPNAAELRSRLSDSRIVTLRGANVHGVYAGYGNTCVDTNVNTYLDTGKLPATDLVCENM